MNKKRLANFALLFASVTIALIIGELICRHYKMYQSYCERTAKRPYYNSLYATPHEGWLHTYSPNKSWLNSKNEYAYPEHTNSLGIRDKEYDVQKHNNVYRIVTLGDSFTEGEGAPEDSTWPRLLQQLLIAGRHDSVEVINAGVSGSDPLYEYQLLKLKMLTYNPDMVIVAVNESDKVDCMVRGGFERFKTNGTVQYRKGPWWEGIYAKSVLFRVIIHKIFNYNLLLLTPKENGTRGQKAFATLMATNDSLYNVCKLHNCQLVLAFHPMPDEIVYKVLAIEPVLTDANAKGYHCINLLDTFKPICTGNNCESYYWPIDGHHKPAGYLIFAQALAQYIVANQLMVNTPTTP